MPIQLRVSILGVALALQLAGCVHRDGNVTRCHARSGEYPLILLGGAFGRGRLRLERETTSPSTNDQPLRGRLSLWGTGADPGTGAPLELVGSGICEGRFFKLRFDSIRAKMARVLGGELIGTFPPSHLARKAFGLWRADVHVARDNRTRQLKGQWRQLESDEAVPPASSAATATTAATGHAAPPPTQ